MHICCIYIAYVFTLIHMHICCIYIAYIFTLIIELKKVTPLRGKFWELAPLAPIIGGSQKPPLHLVTSHQRVGWRWEVKWNLKFGVSEKEINMPSVPWWHIIASVELNRIRRLLKCLGASFTGTYLHPFLLSPLQPHLTPSPCEDLRIDRGRSAPLKECPQKKPVFLHSCLLAPIYLLPPLSCKAGAKSFYSGVAIHNIWICQI